MKRQLTALLCAILLLSPAGCRASEEDAADALEGAGDMAGMESSLPDNPPEPGLDPASGEIRAEELRSAVSWISQPRP